MKLFSSKIKENEFLVYFKQHARIGAECSKALAALCSSGALEHFQRIEELEHEGDQVCTDVHKLVDRTFIALFDKPDILSLTDHLDNIPDTMKTVARKIVIFGLEKTRQGTGHFQTALRFCRLIDESVLELQGVIDMLPHFDSDHLRASVLKINTLEDQADDLYDEALAGLFHDLNAPVTVSMQLWSEIFRLLETVTDHSLDAADTLMSLARKEGH